jgi:hypothetical protein
MATGLTKPVRREVLIGPPDQIGTPWIVTLYPADEVHRFPRIEFREKRRRKIRYWLPMESARNEAARKWNMIQEREKKALRKQRQELRKQGLL